MGPIDISYTRIYTIQIKERARGPAPTTTYYIFSSLHSTHSSCHPRCWLPKTFNGIYRYRTYFYMRNIITKLTKSSCICGFHYQLYQSMPRTIEILFQIIHNFISRELIEFSQRIIDRFKRIDHNIVGRYAMDIYRKYYSKTRWNMFELLITPSPLTATCHQLHIIVRGSFRPPRKVIIYLYHNPNNMTNIRFSEGFYFFVKENLMLIETENRNLLYKRVWE